MTSPSIADKTVRAISFLGKYNKCEVEITTHPAYTMVQWYKGDDNETAFLIFHSLGMKEYVEVITRANRLTDLVFGE